MERDNHWTCKRSRSNRCQS